MRGWSVCIPAWFRWPLCCFPAHWSAGFSAWQHSQRRPGTAGALPGSPWRPAGEWPQVSCWAASSGWTRPPSTPAVQGGVRPFSKWCMCIARAHSCTMLQALTNLNKKLPCPISAFLTQGFRALRCWCNLSSKHPSTSLNLWAGRECRSRELML